MHVTLQDYRDYTWQLYHSRMNIIELFGRAKDLQQAASAKLGEEMEVVTINSGVECSRECNSTLRSGGLVPSNSSSSRGQEDGDRYENYKEFDEGNDENQDCLEDNGEHLMR